MFFMCNNVVTKLYRYNENGVADIKETCYLKLERGRPLQMTAGALFPAAPGSKGSRSLNLCKKVSAKFYDLFLLTV